LNKDIRILIVDDESAVRDSLKKWFEDDGYTVEVACDGPVALKKLESARFDILLIDIRMPGMDGMKLHERLRKIDPSLVVIIMTAYATVDTAVAAMKRGAFDYISKPFEPENLSELIGKAIREHGIGTEERAAERGITIPPVFDEIVGESVRIREVMEMVKNVATTDVTVLIQGESGTGKELIARAIHFHSRRRHSPFIPISCGALPESLLESELFGHEKGAFTGAQWRRKGKLEMSHGGTAFFDEIYHVSPKTQVDLLRVLETKQISRVGSNESVAVDFRIVCATNQDLRKAVAEGKFREDLYYRINVFSIVLPPLRERRTDIPLLADHFIRRTAAAIGKPIEGISEEAMEVLAAYSWPGNVRELENAIERAMVVAKGSVIDANDLPPLHPGGRSAARDDSLEEVAREHILRVLDLSDWNMTRAARVLKIDRVTLYNKVKKFGLERPAKSDSSDEE
jgi:two-component system response regulator AtoC